MQCSSNSCYAKDRCIFSSLFLLGALFGLMSSPCARSTGMAAAVILGVPLITFSVVAPSRLGLLRELALLGRGLEAGILTTLLTFVGRVADAQRVLRLQRARVEAAYARTDERIADIALSNPARLHHARRIAGFLAVLAVFAGVGLPMLDPQVFTFGNGLEILPTFLLDLIAFSVVGRIVAERIVLRLLEVTQALGAGNGVASHLRVAPLAGIFGLALGAVGSFVVICAGAVACAVETSWVADVGFVEPMRWFVCSTIFSALPLGMMAGAIAGVGMGVALSPKDDSNKNNQAMMRVSR